LRSISVGLTCNRHTDFDKAVCFDDHFTMFSSLIS
jgi:hypothetical protein